MSKYDLEDIENLVCLCKDDADKIGKQILKKCQKALSLGTTHIRITSEQSNYLLGKYSHGMDQKLMFTLNRVMGM